MTCYQLGENLMKLKSLKLTLFLTTCLIPVEASVKKVTLTTKGVKNTPVAASDDSITPPSDDLAASASDARQMPQQSLIASSRINFSTYSSKNLNDVLKSLKENPDMVFTVTIDVSPEGEAILPKIRMQNSLALKQIKHLVLETSGGSLTKLPDGIFQNLKNLESLTLPEEITELGAMVCDGCTKLTKVNFSKSLEVIGDRAFAGCPLESINFPEGLKKIGSFAFNGAKFAKLDLPKSLGADSENTWTIGFGAFQNNKALKSARIPVGIVQLGGTFAGCSALEEVTLPNTLLRVWHSTFANCESLRKVDIPDSVVVIGNEAFAGCKNMSSVVIPEAVTFIDSNAFSNCTRLETLEFKGNPPQSFANNFVDFTFSLKTVIIPKASSEADYKNILTAIVNRFSSMYDIRSRYRDDLALSLPKGIPNIPKEASEYMEQMKSIASVEQAGLLFYKSREAIDREIATLGMTPEEVTKRKIDIVKK